VERFIETPEMKRRHQEEMGFCWFCGCKQGCESCERWVDPDTEGLLGKENFWDDEELIEEEEERPRKRARATKGKGKEKAVGAPKQTRAKTRSQGKAGQSSRHKKAKGTPLPHNEYSENLYQTSMAAGSPQPALWHENPASYQPYEQLSSPYIPQQPGIGSRGYQDDEYAYHHAQLEVPQSSYKDHLPYMTPPADELQLFVPEGIPSYQETDHQDSEQNWESLVDPNLDNYKTLASTYEQQHGMQAFPGYDGGESSTTDYTYVTPENDTWRGQAETVRTI
jgi:hypothetical protein